MLPVTPASRRVRTLPRGDRFGTRDSWFRGQREDALSSSDAHRAASVRCGMRRPVDLRRRAVLRQPRLVPISSLLWDGDAVPIDEERLREILATEEGQYHDLKSLFAGPPGRKQPRERRAVRGQIAEQVAGFANADGGIVVFGVEDDGSVTGHGYARDEIELMLAVPRTRLIPPQ